MLTDSTREDGRASSRLPASGLDFLLDGTIQRNGSLVRVIVRLSDIRSGGIVVWTRRFDRNIADIFTLQDEIAAETASQVDTALLLWEGERARFRGSADPDALDLMLGAIPSIYRLEQHEFHDAGGLLEASLALDSGNAVAHAWLAYWHLFQVGQGWAPDAAAATARAAELAERAVGLDARDARAMTLAGHVRGFLGKRPEEARALHDQAIALNPNLALAWCFSGLAHSYLGDHAEATCRIQQAQRLSPHDPHGFFFDTAQIMPNLLLRNYEAAVAIGRRATALNPGFSSSLKGLLAALGHLGRDPRSGRGAPAPVGAGTEFLDQGCGRAITHDSRRRRCPLCRRVTPRWVAGITRRGGWRLPNRQYVICHASEHFRHMPYFDVAPLPSEASCEMKQTAKIAGEDSVGPGRKTVARLVGGHPHRNLRILDAERAAKSAAYLRVGHFNDLDTHRTQQPARLRLDAEFAQSRATVVVGDGPPLYRACMRSNPRTSVRKLTSSKVRPASASARTRRLGSSSNRCGRWCFSMPPHDPDGTTT